MKSLLALALSLPLLLASPTGSSSLSQQGYRIPTSYESAVMGRRMLALTKLADISTTFPHPKSSSGREDEDEMALMHRPEGLEGLPINLMDYVASCEEPTGNPTLLAVKIATTFRNAAAGSNVSLSLRWTPPYPPAKRISLSIWERVSRAAGLLFGYDYPDYMNGEAYPGGDDDEYADIFSGPPDTVPYSAANLPRVSLMGYLEPIKREETPHSELAACFVRTHGDAKYWLPGNPIHASYWARLVVTQVFWVGGFGDRAYIGWIPIDEWRKVTREEWEGIRLPGEKKGWKEWSVEEEWASDL